MTPATSPSIRSSATFNSIRREQSTETVIKSGQYRRGRECLRCGWPTCRYASRWSVNECAGIRRLRKLLAEYGSPVPGGTQYLFSDHQGSPRAITSSNGSIVSRHDYLPFGEELGAVGMRTSGQGYGAQTVRDRSMREWRVMTRRGRRTLFGANTIRLVADGPCPIPMVEVCLSPARKLQPLLICKQRSGECG